MPHSHAFWGGKKLKVPSLLAASPFVIGDRRAASMDKCMEGGGVLGNFLFDTYFFGIRVHHHWANDRVWGSTGCGSTATASLTCP